MLSSSNLQPPRFEDIERLSGFLSGKDLWLSSIFFPIFTNLNFFVYASKISFPTSRSREKRLTQTVIASDYLGFVAYALNLKEHGLDCNNFDWITKLTIRSLLIIAVIVFLWISYMKIEEHASFFKSTSKVARDATSSWPFTSILACGFALITMVSKGQLLIFSRRSSIKQFWLQA